MKPYLLGHCARIILICAVASITLVACGGGSGGSSGSGNNTALPPDNSPPVPPPGPHFSVLPVPVEALARITPMGFNNKVFPTPHSYWIFCDHGIYLNVSRPCQPEYHTLRAPADGIILDLDPQEDGNIRVEGPPGLIWTFGHVTPAEGLTIGSQVSAGQTVATSFADTGFDFGLINYGVEHYWINPSRYHVGYLYSQNPIEQFPSAVADQLLELVNTVDGNPLGRLSYDVAGTASGAWFIEGADQALMFGNDHMLLWLARYVEREETRILSVGERWPGMVNRLLVVDPDAPDWEDITPDGGILTIKLWNMSSEVLPRYDWPSGTLLLEMPDADTLRVEWFDTHEPIQEMFGDQMRIYER